MNLHCFTTQNRSGRKTNNIGDAFSAWIENSGSEWRNKIIYMSEILIGYAKIDSLENIDICKTELFSCAKNGGIGIWFGSDVHKEEIIDEYRQKSDFLIFSITDSFEFENIHKVLWSDLCRDEQRCSLSEDVEKIVALLRIILGYTDKINLFWGSYGCFSWEYKEKIEIYLDDFKKCLINYISNDDRGLKHFIIKVKAQNIDRP